MATSKSTVECIWSADIRVVEYAREFMAAVIDGNENTVKPPPDFKRASNDFISRLYSSLLSSPGRWFRRRKDPASLLRDAEGRVYAALDRHTEWVVCNLALHSKKVLGGMNHLAWKWLWRHVLHAVDPSSHGSSLVNFSSLSFSPCGFLIVLAAAETHHGNPGSAAALMSMFRRALETEKDLRSGDIILIRFFDDFLEKESPHEFDFREAFLPYDTLNKIGSGHLDLDWENEPWWGIVDLLRRPTRQKETNNMVAYICWNLLDVRRIKREPLLGNRIRLEKWTSCFKRLMFYDVLRGEFDLETWFNLLKPDIKKELKTSIEGLLKTFQGLHCNRLAMEWLLDILPDLTRNGRDILTSGSRALDRAMVNDIVQGHIDFMSYFNRLETSRKTDLMIFSRRFWEIFQCLYSAHNVVLHGPLPEREERLSFHHFFLWLHRDIDAYVRGEAGKMDALAPGEESPHEKEQRIEGEYNNRFKFVFLCLHMILAKGSSEMAVNLRTIARKIIFGMKFNMESPFDERPSQPPREK